MLLGLGLSIGSPVARARQHAAGLAPACGPGWSAGDHVTVTVTVIGPGPELL